MRKLAERWLSFAHKDLLVARQLVDQPEDIVNEFYIETIYPLHEDHDPMKISRAQLDQMISVAEIATVKLRDEINSVAS